MAIVWSLCDGTKTKEDIAENLAKSSGIEKSKIEDAVMKILAQLEQAGLVQKA